MSEVKLLPCPVCGCVNLKRFKMLSSNTIRCDNCKIRVVYALACDESVKLWNAFPRSLTWTTEPPVLAGKYFRRCRYDGAWEDTSDVISIDRRVYHRDEDIQWAGPIPAPQESTA